jgi:uncharacterized protein YjbJ (UPF0337 family)
MNKDQVKGATKEATGEIKEHVGRALNDSEMEAKGHAKEQEGKLQKNLGDAKEVVIDKSRDLDDQARRDLDRK